MVLKKWAAAAVVIAGFSGCIPKMPAPSQKTVTVTIEPPPVPPTKAELDKPPDVPLEKPSRDPFIVLRSGGGGESITSSQGEGGAGGSFIVTGIMIGRPYNSAILESGSDSYIVHPGQRVSGYRVTSVTKKSVTLTNGKEKLTLWLTGGK